MLDWNNSFTVSTSFDKTAIAEVATKSFCQRLGEIKTTKNSDWRNGHISSDLKDVLIELKNIRGKEEFVLPRLSGRDHGMAGEILRTFLRSFGIEKYVNFHTLRDCFATHVLASGADQHKL